MDSESIHVLLIEDILIYTSLLQRMLIASNISLDQAESLAAGIQKAEQKSYQAILLDLGLPDSQGLDTFIQFQRRFPNIPIIVFSGYDDEQLAAQAVQKGAQDYLIKGAYLTQGEAGKNLLIRSIHYAIERHQIQSALRRERDQLEMHVAERTSELRQANERLKSELIERRRYEFIANTSKDPISLIDRNYTYQAVNDGFCQAHSKQRSELIGKTIAQVWGAEAFETKIRPYIDQALKGIETRYEGWFEFKTLGYRYFEVFYNPFFDMDHHVTHVVVVSHDETIREKAKESLRHHNQRLSLLREIDHATLAAKSPEEIVRVALRHFVRLAPYDRADVLLFPTDGTSPVTMITGGVEGEAKINLVQFSVKDILSNRQLSLGKPHIVHRALQTAELSPFDCYLRQRGVRSFFIVPLHADGKMIGALSVSSFDVDTFLPNHIEDTLAISIPLALLIKNAQLMEQLRTANERLLNLTSRLVSAQEDERRRISLELHDEAGQSLTALKLSLALIQAELPEASESVQAQIREAIALTEKTMNDLRALAHNLHPPAIEAVGLSQTLHDYCMRLARQTGIEITYRDNHLGNLPAHIQISIYRVVQEALTNIVKHSGATRVDVRLDNDAEKIRLKVTDNGRGFISGQPETTENKPGLGLTGIHERMQALGGSLEILSQQGRGTQLITRIPLQEAV
jgi:PAS domain S-box-containing protein